MNDFQYIDHQLPYDPSDVDIRQQTFEVGHLAQMIDQNAIELWHKLDFLPESRRWSRKQKSRLVESILMRIPLPVLYFDGSDKPWKVIDGLRRLNTIYAYIIEESFSLNDLEYLKELEGCTFSRLPFKYRRVIEEFKIDAYVINPGTPNKVKLNIFQRINTKGSSLNRQEIRNAYYRESAMFVNQLAENPVFLKATQKKLSKKGMKDRDGVLRFIGFYKYFEYYKPPLESFLDQTMEDIQSLSTLDKEELKKDFERSMNACMLLFEGSAFLLLNINGETHNRTINISLFETWAVNLAKCNIDQINTLINHRAEIINAFVLLLQDKEFHSSISSDTSSEKAIERRFTEVKNLINNIFNANRP